MAVRLQSADGTADAGRESHPSMEDLIWTVVPALATVITAWLAGKVGGRCGSSWLWAGTAAACSLLGLLGPRCLCVELMDRLIGSLLSASALGFVVGLSVYVVLVIRRPRRSG